MSISLRNVNKAFPDHNGHHQKVLSNITVDVGEGRVLAVLGPNGCGKSTLLNLVAGFESPTTGTVSVNAVSGAANIGYMLQSFRYMLYPWMSVRDNIGFPLAARYQTPASVYSTVENLVERYNVPINLDAYPAKQSIGQRQMCALLQVLMQEPTHILMDEPLASLDPESKWKMLSAISDYVRAKSCTCMIVLHDVDDALLAAHNVIVLSRRPGQLAHSFSVDFDYPRSAHLSTTQPFLSLRSSVLKALLQEVQA